MSTRTISLTEQQDRFVDDAVASGRYQDAGDVLREGLALLEQRQAEDAAKLTRLLAAIGEGDAAYVRGEYEEVEVERLDDWLAGLGRTGNG